MINIINEEIVKPTILVKDMEEGKRYFFEDNNNSFSDLVAMLRKENKLYIAHLWNEFGTEYRTTELTSDEESQFVIINLNNAMDMIKEKEDGFMNYPKIIADTLGVEEDKINIENLSLENFHDIVYSTMYEIWGYETIEDDSILVYDTADDIEFLLP